VRVFDVSETLLYVRSGGTVNCTDGAAISRVFPAEERRRGVTFLFMITGGFLLPDFFYRGCGRFLQMRTVCFLLGRFLSETAPISSNKRLSFMIGAGSVVLVECLCFTAVFCQVSCPLLLIYLLVAIVSLITVIWYVALKNE
jgi:hypothetical protein